MPMSGFMGRERVAALVLLLSAGVPNVPEDLLKITGPKTAGVRERIPVNAAPTALAHAPVCGGAKLATSLKSSSKGGYAPPGARLLRDNPVGTVDMNALLRNGDFSQNVWTKPRDMIFALRKQDMSVYVIGAVGSPQAVAYGAERRTRLQVLSMAGGPISGVAQLGGIRIVRSNSPTPGELIVFDARKSLSERGLDLPLKPGEMVYVPSSELGDWNSAVAQILPSLQVLGGILTPINLIQNLNCN